jgi:hypothetical protein
MKIDARHKGRTTLRSKIIKKMVLLFLLVGCLMSLPVKAVIIHLNSDEDKSKEHGRRFSSEFVHVGGSDEEVPKYVEHAAIQYGSINRRNAAHRTSQQFHEKDLTETPNRLRQNLNDAQTSRTASESAAPRYSIADFQNRRWLEGDWHRTENGKNDFYERYRFAGEDRLEMQAFTDAMMTQRGNEKSDTFLKDGAIYHQAGRGVWIAERLSKNEIAFAPKENVRNSFIWKMQSPDVWTAEISFTGRDGQPKRTIYRLERIKKTGVSL